MSSLPKVRNYESINCIYSHFVFKGILRNNSVLNCLNCLSFLLLCNVRLRSYKPLLKEAGSLINGVAIDAVVGPEYIYAHPHSVWAICGADASSGAQHF